MSYFYDSHFECSAEGVPDCGARGANGTPSAEPAPRVVTTGRKNTVQPQYAGIDSDTGEPVELVSKGKHIAAIRHLVDEPSVHPQAAFIDTLAFSVVPPGESSYVWVLQQMQRFLDIGQIEYRGGLFGFQRSARFGDGAGVIAWGGKSQNDRVYFSVQGKGCAQITDWHGLAQWLEQHKAAIKRADVAYDDFEGKLISIAWAVNQYKQDGFNAGGRKPSSECAGDWLQGEASTKGRTLYIGSRDAGKLLRCYEKGKQLGDAASRWTRIEVEWRAQDRYIPYDILTRPAHYLAGAYPCLAFINEIQERVRTIAKGAQICFDRAVENAKQLCGKTINLMLQVFGGDYVDVINRLKRDGFPARIAPYSYHVARDPSMLDKALVGASP